MHEPDESGGGPSPVEPQVRSTAEPTVEAPTETVIPTVGERPDAPQADPTDLRSEWAIRIRAEKRLPGSLRERLAAAVEQSTSTDREPLLSVTQVAQVFADAVPMLLTLDSSRTAIVEHPQGEAFFQNGTLSDQEAARIARDQLARTGFGRS